MARKLMQYLAAKDAAEESIKENILQVFSPFLKYGADKIEMYGGHVNDGYLFEVSGVREWSCGDTSTEGIVVSGKFIDAMLEQPNLAARQAFVKAEVDRREVAAAELKKVNDERLRRAAIAELEGRLAKLRGESS